MLTYRRTRYLPSADPFTDIEKAVMCKNCNQHESLHDSEDSCPIPDNEVAINSGQPAPASVPVSLCVTCGQPRPLGSWPYCDDSSGRHGHGYGRGGNLISSIHPSERAVVYVNPKTGEHRTPARADQVMPEVYRRQGYERHELDTHQKRIEFERKTGLVHEASHCDRGSATAERSLLTNVEEAPPIKNLDQAYGDPILTVGAKV